MSCKKCLHHKRNKKACEDCSRLSNVMEPNPRFVENNNYNRIKNMTVEEMAVFFAKINARVHRADLPVVAYYGEDVNRNIDWLMQEVADE